MHGHSMSSKGALFVVAFAYLFAMAQGFTSPVTLRPARVAKALKAPDSMSRTILAPALSEGRRSGAHTMLNAESVKRSKQELEQRASVREALYPTVRRLADNLEQTLRDNLDLSPFKFDDDMMYVEGKVDGGRCVLENSMWQSPEFRKIHIELATFFNSAGESTGLDILHCVLFPRSEVVGPEVPMFGCDLVCAKGAITAAIVDLSPMSKEKKLAADYYEHFDRRAGPYSKFSQPREVPEFGSYIFSDRCNFMRPEGPEEEEQFIKLCKEVMTLHCELAGKRVGQDISESEKCEAVEGQRFYCSKQSENDKTRRILIQTFGKDWTERYMTTVLFDPPKA